MPAKIANVGTQFSRLFDVPLDKDLVFANTGARNNYLSNSLTSGIAYTGMIVADLETNKVYMLDTTRAWKEVGISINETFGANNSGILIKTGDGTFAVRGLSSGNNIFISNPSGIDGNPNISLSTSVTGLSGLSSVSGLFSTSLSVNGSLTLNGRNVTTSLEASQNTNTANFNLGVGSITDVGSNGGPSYYGTYDQGGNVREIMYSGSTAVPMRGGNFASDDQLIRTHRGSQAPTNYGPGFGVRFASRENIGKSYSLVFNSTTGIATSDGVIHGFQLGDPLKFANDVGLPTSLSSGTTYYVISTGSTTFSVASSTVGSPISIATTAGTTSAYSAYDYGSFVRVENPGNAADTTNYGGVNYKYRIGKFELTNDEYVEFLNATARDDHDSGNFSYFDSSVDMGLYDPMMETEAPNNGISRNAVFPDHYYASLRGMNKKPAVFISYIDAARYANWLHNGKPVSTRYKNCLIITAGSVTTVILDNHGYSAGDEISFNCSDGGTFGGGGSLTKNTKFKVAISGLTSSSFVVNTIENGNVTFTGTGGAFYVKKFYNKSTYLNNGAYALDNNELTAKPKNSGARYWIPTENEWYKAAYYDPAKTGAESPGYWNYPTRSDTVPSPISADSDGNGSYNGGGTLPSHYHSSYDISDLVDRIGGILVDGSGTKPIYNSSSSTIAINVTGIPLSTIKDVTASFTEVNYLSGIVLGSGSSSKVLALDTNKSISGISRLAADTGVFNSGSFGASTSADSASTLRVGGTGVSLSGHKHNYIVGEGFADIPNFCSGVADCVNTSLLGGSGLVLNYSSNSVSIDIGQGDGITVGSNTIAVNDTVIRTTGTQLIDGLKTFSGVTTFRSGITSSGTNTFQVSTLSATPNTFVVFSEDPSTAAKTIYTRTPSQVKTDIELGNLTNHTQIKQTTNDTIAGYVPTWNSTSGESLGTGYIVETTLTNTSLALPRSDAVKNYVDGLFATNDAMIYKGVIDASPNPFYPSGDSGHTYKISVTGRIGGSSGPLVEVGDILVCNRDFSVSVNSGLHANVGDYWNIIQGNIDGAVIGPSSSATDNFALFNSSTGKLIKDAGFGTGVYALSSRTITPGSGLFGETGLALTSDITLHIGSGDGITVGSNNIAVDSSVVRTTGANYGNGKLFIGSGTSLHIATLTAGTGISITNAAGSITINSSVLNAVTGIGDGAETSGYLSRWVSSSGLKNSNIYEKNSQIGIGITNPSGTFHVSGTGYFTDIKFLADGEYVSAAPIGHSHLSDDILTAISNDFGNLNTLVDSFASYGQGSANQLLRKNAGNNAYEFTSSLTDITIDCGTF